MIVFEEHADFLKDEADWEDYVNGKQRQDRLFCASCGYLIDAHWHTNGADVEWYACPNEAKAKEWWGR